MKKALVSLLLGVSLCGIFSNTVSADVKKVEKEKEPEKVTEIQMKAEDFGLTSDSFDIEYSLSYDGITELEGTITNNTKYPIVGLDVYFTKDEKIWGASSQEKDYGEWNDVVLPNDTDELHASELGEHKAIKYIEFQLITEENKVINVKYNIKKDKFTVYESVDRSAISDIGRNDLYVVKKYYEEEVDVVWNLE